MGRKIRLGKKVYSFRLYIHTRLWGFVFSGLRITPLYRFFVKRIDKIIADFYGDTLLSPLFVASVKTVRQKTDKNRFIKIAAPTSFG